MKPEIHAIVAAVNELTRQMAVDAERIEKLEEENGVLFAANVRLNSRADLDCDHYHERIEKLEAALDDMSQYLSRADWHYLKPETIAALEGKDG
jgi:hypothetical protein